MPTHNLTTGRHRAGSVACLVVAMAAAIGCQSLIIPSDQAVNSLLKPVRTAPDSVSLEIFQARIPLDKEGKADALWDKIDEQAFSADLRRQLVANGLRAGVVGGALPDDLASLLKPDADANGSDESNSRRITDQSAIPRVTRRVMSLKRSEAKVVKVSDLRDEAQVLISDAGSFGGRTFRQLEGMYAVEAELVPGQQVNVRLTPELHHGDMKQRYAGSDQGIFMSIASREREVFEKLTMEATLSPGQLLIVGCLPDAKASLGGVFHTASVAGKDERKLIMVRLQQVPRSEILAEK